MLPELWWVYVLPTRVGQTPVSEAREMDVYTVRRVDGVVLLEV